MTDTTAAKILIFGTGAVGSASGYMLHQGGAEVTAVCRSNYGVVQANGITVESALWGAVHYRPHVVQTVAEAAPYGPFDFVVVCSKAFPRTCELIREAVTSTTTIVLAQNGIGIEQEYAEMYVDNTIISGVVWLPAAQTAPGVVALGANHKLKLGTFPATAGAAHKAKVRELSAIFTRGGGAAPVYEDVQAERWAKLALNVAFNPMCALSRCDNANLLRSSDNADAMIVEVLKEVGNIAAADGYTVFSEKDIDAIMAFHRGFKDSGGKNPSMLIDVQAGRPLEVEAILGNTTRIGHQHGVSIPRVEMLYCLAQALNFSIVKPDRWMQPAIY